MQTCPNDICEDRFARLERRVDKKSDELDIQQEKIARLEEKFDSLTRSIQALTKALWGMSGAIVSVLLGFFVWYVQTL